MHRTLLAAAIAALTVGSVATANAQTHQCHQDNRVAGTVIGGVVGATAGGLIANNVRRDRFVHRRGFHSRRGFRGRGFRGGRRGNQGLGIVLGALAGGVIGNQIAANNVRNCRVVVGPQHRGDPYAGQQHTTVLTRGPIDHNAARLGDPYGGARVVTPQTPDRQAPRQQQAPSGVFQPICETVFQTTDLPNGEQIREPIEVCQFSEGGEWIPR